MTFIGDDYALTVQRQPLRHGRDLIVQFDDKATGSVVYAQDTARIGRCGLEKEIPVLQRAPAEELGVVHHASGSPRENTEQTLETSTVDADKGIRFADGLKDQVLAVGMLHLKRYHGPVITVRRLHPPDILHKRGSLKRLQDRDESAVQIRPVRLPAGQHILQRRGITCLVLRRFSVGDEDLGARLGYKADTNTLS